ncbi:hypothetical protein LR48_Vigan11g061400 [Vigna angularis]|uniref:Putative plant transposon protein domain-containing protein n=1 Tax=Phaseolus angularis TaxID=3914 RepID=A0A0L9VR81_PHAAN|nr:hypothetical protein LR48_Vigan11g061400 [Vigna angularis]
MVHHGSEDEQLKLGALVRFKGTVWVVKEFKDNGVIEIEAPYSRRVKKMKLMKEVKRDRDGIRKGHKKCKRRETASTTQPKLPLSGTLKDPLAPLRGEMPLRRRMKHALLPLSGTFLGLGLLFCFKVNLMKGVKKDKDGIRKQLKKFKRREAVGEQCQFALCMEEGIDFDDVESVLCVPGGHFQKNRTGFVVNIRRTDWNPLAKYWMAFSHANIKPCSHVSDITLSRALLLYCAIRNLNVNIGQVIANEIQMCANTINSKAPLGHPSLITHLCKIAGVDTSSPPFERPRKVIDEAYYKQYCGGKEAAQPVPPRRPHRERGQAQSAQLQSIHRGQVATAEMIVGMYDTPPAHRWTMDEFHNVVAWPEEQAQGGRAGTAEA